MTDNPKRPLVLIRATSVTDFRAQLDAAIAEARIVQLEPEDDGDPDALLRALLSAARGIVARQAVVQSERERAA